MKTLRPDHSVRLIAYAHPEARAVLERHGEPCGRGVFGHLEPLERFARRRGLDPETLLEELSVATGLPADPSAPQLERVHRPFVLAALIIAFTVGAGWGAWLLARIGVAADFTAIGAGQVVAHGDAQLWGFLTIFIVGIAVRYLPDVSGTPRPGLGRAGAVLGALLGGTALGFAWSCAPELWPDAGVVSGSLLVAAAILFGAMVLRAVASRRREPWALFIASSAVWLFVWALWTLFLRGAAGATGPSAYTASERELALGLALWGVAASAVFGFGCRLLPGFLGTGGVRKVWLWFALGFHQAGTLALVLAHHLAAVALAVVAWSSLVAGVASYAWALRGLRGRPHAHTPEKGHPYLRRYVQTAFVWLAVSILGFLALDVHELATGRSADHALTGAVRHAVTVGFLTTLMLGVAQRLLPILGHTHLAFSRLVVPIHLLLTVGCAMRVGTEALSPWFLSAMRWMPLSSLLELLAIALFAVNAIRTMWPRPDPLLRTGQVTTDSRLAVLLAEHPWMEDRLIGWGVDYVARVRQVPAQLGLRSLARAAWLDPDQLVEWINEALSEARLRNRRERTRPATRS